MGSEKDTKGGFKSIGYVLLPNGVIPLFFISSMYIRCRLCCFKKQQQHHKPTSLDPSERFNFWQVLMRWRPHLPLGTKPFTLGL